MSVDKLVDSTQLDSDLTSVANAIRTKGGTSSQMSFPSGFVSAIENIHTGSTPTGTKEISITENGTTTEDVTDYAYAEIEVAVPASAVDSGTKNITANGTGQDVVGYAAVDVAVPNTYAAGDEGKVVDDGALVSQTAHADVTPTTSDQTINTTTNNSIKVKGDADLVAGNIKKDVEIFGVTGSYEGSGGGSMSGSEIVEHILNRSISGDVDIVVTNPTPANSTNIAMYNGLLQACAIRNLKLTGSWNIPNSFCRQYLQGASPSIQSTLLSVESDAEYAGNGAFANASTLQTVKLPNLRVGYYNYQRNTTNMFLSCTSLTKVAFPVLERCDQDFLGSCTSLTEVDLRAVTFIGTYSFRNSTSFNKLIIGGSIVCQLENINAFNSTPFASGNAGGTLYVPQSMISSYQSASNWSTILGYANNSIVSIEGSAYANYYADGTPISA